MEGHTQQYYSLFLKAKENYCENRIKRELDSDPSNYKNIYQKIQEALNDENGIGIDSLHIRQQLIIEEKLNPHLSREINESLSIFGTLRDATKGKVLDLSNDCAWITSIKYTLLYYDNKDRLANHGAPEEYTHIAESILELKKLGFKIQSIDGHIKVDDPELLRLATAIDYRVSILGKKGLVIFNNIIANKFSRSDNRFFFFRRRKTLPSPQKPSAPYGYLFNLFCKYTETKPKIRNNHVTKILDEIQELSTHLSTIINIDKMSPWANLNVTQENILEKLKEWVLYPEIFYIPQISPNHGKVIFPRIFELIKDLPNECRDEITITAKVLQRIEDQIMQEGAISGELSEQEVLNLCSDIASQNTLLGVLRKVSTPSKLINKDYKTPFDAHKSNIKENPLIKTTTSYIVANIATYNIAKYRTLLSISTCHHPKTEQNLGFALEDFIKENFIKSNIQFHHSFKYLTPKYINQITQTNRHEGECDFIIETKDYIYLIEVKKKGLTKDSQSGSDIHLLIDTTLSFLKSINQLSIAEVILLNEDKITSRTGETINLRNRDIFKLAISFEDMASLQCDNIKSSLLTGLYNTEITLSDNKENEFVKEINRTLQEFTKIHIELSNKNIKYKRNPFHDISYISTPQLLTILGDTDNNEDFSHNIYCSNTIILSLMDWYASYKVAKENKLIKENKSIFKNTVLIN